MLNFHPQGIGEGFDRVFAGGIDAPERNSEVGKGAADIDQCSSLVPKMFHGNTGSVHHAPVIRIEEASLVCNGHFRDATVCGDAGTVDPGVDPAVPAHGFVRHPTQCRLVCDICRHEGSDSAVRFVPLDLLGEFAKRVFVPAGEDQAAAPTSGEVRRDQTDPAGGAGDDDDLFADRFEAKRHGIPASLTALK